MMAWLVLAGGPPEGFTSREEALARARQIVDERGHRITGGAWDWRDQGEIVVAEVAHRIALVRGGDGLWGWQDVLEKGKEQEQ